MLKNHPKGLLVAFFANMGERFGFYTMMACLVFYLQARYALPEAQAGNIYSWFYFAIYALALVGGFVADKTQSYKGTIFVGIVTMLAGYVIMTVPGMGLPVTIAGLFIIALGNGLFKGNLQAVVGQMYDDPKYSHMRDTAFSIFYMGINIGAMFAPSAANGIRNWYLKSQGLAYNADLAKFCNAHIGQISDQTQNISELGSAMTGSPITDINAFAQGYIDAFSTGYNYAFGVAGVAMIISFLVYTFFKAKLPDVKKEAVSTDAATNSKLANPRVLVISAIFLIATPVILYFVGQFELGLALGLFLAFVSYMFQVSTKEEKPRINSLVLVFAVVIFFWMSFHQNGLTLSFFARDYTATEVGKVSSLLFNIWPAFSIVVFLYAVGNLLKRGSELRARLIAGVVAVAAAAVVVIFYRNAGDATPIEPEIFQQFNPIFIVLLTPVAVALFGYLNKKKKEPSTPKKIGIGMILAAAGFVIMVVGSRTLTSPGALDGDPSPERISQYWLINTYLVLTFAELFLSPMGLSFVSKVAPKRFQGLMQGGWLLATAVGNKLLFIGSSLWTKVELWQLWLIFVVCCLVSALFIFSILKKLERATSD